ncbi:von Willebrand factor a domain-containing protein 8, partial [Plakobranchus ocellatus]
INEERESGRDHEDVDPKHGKEDPQNQPHVGGNTWAGGVGKRVVKMYSSHDSQFVWNPAYVKTFEEA